MGFGFGQNQEEAKMNAELILCIKFNNMGELSSTKLIKYYYSQKDKRIRNYYDCVYDNSNLNIHLAFKNLHESLKKQNKTLAIKTRIIEITTKLIIDLNSVYTLDVKEQFEVKFEVLKCF